jgi:hypothetical protein
MRVIGIVLLVVGALFALVLSFADAPPAVSVVPLLLIVAGGFSLHRGRQYSARRIAVPDLQAPGPRVLYLRSFDTDPSILKQTFLPLLTPGLLSGLASEEEQLAEVVRPFGRLVAIGRPNERLPAPGAARIYVDDSAWQALVTEQMTLARLVIIRIGASGGLLWELHQARAVVDPRRLLLVVLGQPKRHLKLAIAEAERALGVRLPRPTGRSVIARPAGIYRFSSSGRPEFLVMRPPFMRRSIYKYFRSAFTFVLRPVFEDFRIPWTRPPVAKMMILSLVLFALLASFFLLAAVW